MCLPVPTRRTSTKYFNLTFYNQYMKELGLFKDFTADYFNGKVHVNKIVKKYAVVLVDVFTQAMT